jgi:hypothetical protein
MSIYLLLARSIEEVTKLESFQGRLQPIENRYLLLEFRFSNIG